MGLVGMFFIVNRPDTYCTGRFISAITDTIYLVRPDSAIDDNGPMLPMEAVTIGELTADSPDGMKVWSIFATKEELDTWLKSNPRVVNLVMPAR